MRVTKGGKRGWTYKKVTAGMELDLPDNLLERIGYWTKINYDFLHLIGYRARKRLWFKYLQGQMINYHGKNYDERQRRKTTYRIEKNRTGVAIKSYPLNFWERSMTRRGSKTRGRGILRKLGQDIDGSRISAWADEFLSKATKDL